jgi:lipoate-protein ligase B
MQRLRTETRGAVTVVHAGLMEYGACLALQERLHARVVAGEIGPQVILVEHPPVLTLGRNATEGNMRWPEAWFKERGVAVFHIDRGGEVTAHEPGQLVVYPILRLADHGLAPRSYVALLERAVIATLARFGVAATVDPERPGVWVGTNKICAVGVRVKERATLHGIALNVCNDLSTFREIVACGLKGRGVTTLARVTGRQDLAVAEVATAFVEELSPHLERPVRPAAADLPLLAEAPDAALGPR